jgi:hypothetical protein
MNIEFSMITDVELMTLENFFIDRRGKLKAFSMLDPGGNLLQYSEDFTNLYWDKSSGVSGGALVEDLYGNPVARLMAGTGDASMKAVVGPNSGGLAGMVLCASVYVQVQDPGQSLFIGFCDDSGTLYGHSKQLPHLKWVRLSYSTVISFNGRVRIIIGGNNTWSGGRQLYLFGAQVSPMKGEGAYVKSPPGYGYYETCRFDTDIFAGKMIGPNANAVSLPVVQYF